MNRVSSFTALSACVRACVYLSFHRFWRCLWCHCGRSPTSSSITALYLTGCPSASKRTVRWVGWNRNHACTHIVYLTGCPSASKRTVRWVGWGRNHACMHARAVEILHRCIYRLKQPFWTPFQSKATHVSFIIVSAFSRCT